MKIKLTLIFFFSLLLNRGIGQVISGEANPCPETNYTYTFSGSSFNNYFLWSITDGQIISQNTNTVVVKWYNNITENGKWKLRVQYETIKFDGTSGGSTYLDKDVKVNIPSRYTITGDNEIPGDFRGNKTYTAQIVNSNFPAASFVWTTNTGIQTTTTNPSFNLNITDDQVKWITVSGKSSTCSQWGEIFKFDILYTPVFTGPATICSEGIYTITSPGTITLENAAGVATLTALGNNQWKVTKANNLGGIVVLKSQQGTKSFIKNIKVDPSYLDGIINGSVMIKQTDPDLNYVFEASNNQVDFTDLNWSTNNPYVKITKVNETTATLSFLPGFNIPSGQTNLNLEITASKSNLCGVISVSTTVKIRK
ncbi:hypothetical protein [Sphingobacterium siyangense]|uniref:hypothetical protein n=1 Tax=Sphingobacterium siyangense TaxID=459529 RepID=UPI0028A6136E|nr:hypothetical protein [Sphingobacterium siyangense]